MCHYTFRLAAMIIRKLCNDAVSTAGDREWKVFRRKHNNAILNGACNQLNAAESVLRS
jgi:hypothetical protein